MGKVKKILGVSILLLVSVPANAVIINDKDWLQLAYNSLNQGWNWTDFDAIFDTTTGECDVADCTAVHPNPDPSSTVPVSIDLTGYTWASNSDVNELFMSYTGEAGVNSLNSYNTEELANGALVNFFDDFLPSYSDYENSDLLLTIEGWTRNYSDGDLGNKGDVMWATQLYPGASSERLATAKQGLNIYKKTDCNNPIDCREERPGGWFYKKIAVVPAPPVIWLSIIGLIGLLGFNKRRKAETNKDMSRASRDLSHC